MMSSSNLTSTLALTLARLTREVAPSKVVALMADRLHQVLGQARVGIWLCGPEKGSLVAHSSVGREAVGSVRYVFSEPLRMGYGFLQVEIIDPSIDLEPLPQALQGLADEFASYAERLRLQEQRAKLLSQVAESETDPAHQKSVLRASCLMAQTQGIAPRDGWMCLLAESALTERTMDSVAEEILARPVLLG